jgi:colanic acid/amylovoran biosynthesis glycosyltransferase
VTSPGPTTPRLGGLTVAYLSPDLPALSATFVYEEILAMERRGVRVVPFSVHKQHTPTVPEPELSARTTAIYDGHWFARLGTSIGAVTRLGRRSLRAAAWLVHDLIEGGPSRPDTWKLVPQWLAGATMARQLLRTGCSHLHIHFAHAPTQIGMYASAFSGVPFTVTSHANDIFERAFLLRTKAERSLHFLSISRFNLNHLRGLGVREAKLGLVRCGVTFPIRASKPDFRDKPRYRIGSLGRLVEKKGFDVLIEAVALLGLLGVDVELSLAGDGPLKAALQALVAARGLQGRVHFAGTLQRGEVQPWMQGLDAFALACKPDAQGDMDGIPVVLMEAMSQCVPAVSTRLSGIPELVIDEETGLLAAPGDPGSLATQLARLLQDAELRERLATAGQRHVAKEFGQSTNINRLLLFIGPAHMPGAAQTVRASET